jgi:hypothetical protein
MQTEPEPLKKPGLQMHWFPDLVRKSLIEQVIQLFSDAAEHVRQVIWQAIKHIIKLFTFAY